MTSTIGDAGTDATGAFDPAVNARSKVGHHYRADDYYEIGREKVREYARAVHDYHPFHWHEDAALDAGYCGLLAPLTFMGVVGMVAQRKLFETEITGYDLSQVMQTDQAYEFHRPIVVGDRLTSDVSLQSFRQAFGGDLLTIRTLVTNQYGLPVLTGHTGLVARSGVSEPAVMDAVGQVVMHGFGPGEVPATRPADALAPSAYRCGPAESRSRTSTRSRGHNARPFETVAVGDQLPSRTVALTAGDLVNYAGAAGDPNPIHWSPEVAKLVGLDDGVVAHGMLTMGLGAGLVTSWLGDPGAVLDCNVRFTSPVYVTPDQPGTVEYTGKVKSVDSEARTAVVALVATHRGKKIFGRATVTVQLA